MTCGLATSAVAGYSLPMCCTIHDLFFLLFLLLFSLIFVILLYTFNYEYQRAKDNRLKS